jgi:hypothetical protein
LVDSEVSVEPTPKITTPKNIFSTQTNTVPTEISSLINNVNTESIAQKIVNSPNILELSDFGLIIEKPLFNTYDELNIINKLESYRSKFTEPIYEVEIL